jgi:hypothetical protein
LYVSDQVSLEVISPPSFDPQGQEVQVEVTSPIIMDLGSASFQPYGIGGRFQATLQWVWDTTDLESGTYILDFSIQPDGPAWTESVALHPESQLPPPQPQAHWDSVETDCCEVFYITGTDASRNIADLEQIIDDEAADAVRRMRVAFGKTIPITILPRVLGHGGFTTDEIYVSYLKRNYAGNDFPQVLHHEMIHILDGRLGGDLRPSIFQEGLAVFLSGGHYKPEPIFARAVTLLDLGWYKPLSSLADDFYGSQHEIGYIEAGALTQYLVTTYGWQAFSDFYRDTHPAASGKQSDAIDNALQAHFGITFSQLESRFLAALHRQHLNPDLREDVRLTIAFYNTVRRYQQLLDPSAYFLTAWLPDGKQMRQRGIVADYLRRPIAPENISLENMLVEAGGFLTSGKYPEAGKTISTINVALNHVKEPVLSVAEGPVLSPAEELALSVAKEPVLSETVGADLRCPKSCQDQSKATFNLQPSDLQHSAVEEPVLSAAEGPASDPINPFEFALNALPSPGFGRGK